jgi:hypothetical protein
VRDDRPPRDPALEALDMFVGEWTVAASFPAGAPPALAGRFVAGRARFEWTLGGRFLAQRVQIDKPDAPDSSAIIGADPDGGAYTQHYFDSRGVARVYAMTLDAGVWTLLRDKPDFTPLRFSQRFTGTFSDDETTIAGCWERTEGSSWQHDFGLTYTRVRSSSPA